MKDIYVLLTRSRTWISRLIGLTTSDKYTHASISFDENLSTMYSFSRKYTYTPLPANIQTELLYEGFYKRHNKIPCALYKITVEDEIYDKAKRDVENFLKNKKRYGFNIIGLFCCRFGIKYRRKNKYFCSQFVSHILKENDALHIDKDETLVRPNDFTKFKELKCIYEGKLNELKAKLLLKKC
jgi:inositol transport system substrate-binding protein